MSIQTSEIAFQADENVPVHNHRIDDHYLHFGRHPLNALYQTPRILFDGERGQHLFTAGAYGIARRSTRLSDIGVMLPQPGPAPHFVGFEEYYGRHAMHLSQVLPLPHSTNLNSLFDMGSITASIPVTLLVLWAVTEGLIALDDPITKHVGTLTCTDNYIPTIKDFLIRGVAFTFGDLQKPYSMYGPEDIEFKIYNAHIRRSTFRNSNFPPIILVRMLEVVTGMKFELLARQILFDPLDVHPTFRLAVLPTGVWNTGCSNYVCTGVHGGAYLEGQVHDGLTRQSGCIGAAGLFASVRDLLRIGAFILDRGMIQGQPVIRPDLMALLGKSHHRSRDTDTRGANYGLGFGLWSEFTRGYRPMSVPVHPANWSKGAFFASGFPGTMFACFPQIQTVIVTCTNTVHPKRTEGAGPDARTRLNRLRYQATMMALFGQPPC